MYVRVRAVPGARKEQILEVDDKELVIHVKEPAQRNMANKRIMQIIAERFYVPVRAVHQLSGFRSPTKVFSIDP